MSKADLSHEKIGLNCILALQEEVDATPKPGLVDTLNSGAHKDMDYSTFIASIEAIGPYFTLFSRSGADLETIDHTSLEVLRPLGIQCEKAMYKATDGINTHKGAIFSLGILAASAGYCQNSLGYVTVEDICNVSKTIGVTSLKDFEKSPTGDSITSGHRIYSKYGIEGVRGEAASGFKSVRKYALPLMEELFKKETYSKNDVYIQVLLHLMCNVVDTNVIARKGLDAVGFVQNSAAEVLKSGGALTKTGCIKIMEMDNEFISRNISPGGCADLLSAAIFLHSITS